MAQTKDTQTQGASVNHPRDGQMYRPHDDRVIAGVAVAVANRLGMAPGAVRLIWFILGFFGGLGVLLYIAGWLLIPEEGTTASVAEDAIGRLSDSTSWLGVALIVIAVVMLFTLGGWVRADLAWAVALLAVGVLLYRGQLDAMFDPESRKASDPEVSEGIGASIELDEGASDGGDESSEVTVESPQPK